MGRRTCRHCRGEFAPGPRVPEQRYCSEPACQRARKRPWQPQKISRDEAYRENQRAAQKLWVQKHPHYWKDYRARHPDYAKRDRERQREWNRAQRLGASILPPIAKMDAIVPKAPDLSCRYRLIPLEGTAIAGSLIDSLYEEVDQHSEDLWRLELERRLSELDSGAVKPVPWSEARKRILEP